MAEPSKLLLAKNINQINETYERLVNEYTPRDNDAPNAPRRLARDTALLIVQEIHEMYKEWLKNYQAEVKKIKIPAGMTGVKNYSSPSIIYEMIRGAGVFRKGYDKWNELMQVRGLLEALRNPNNGRMFDDLDALLNAAHEDVKPFTEEAERWRAELFRAIQATGILPRQITSGQRADELMREAEAGGAGEAVTALRYLGEQLREKWARYHDYVKRIKDQMQRIVNTST